MEKIAIVINGQGGVGKDTLCDLAAESFSVYNVSSITPIKDIAREFGWSGAKDDKSRKFLADLKALAVEYNDFPTVWLKRRYNEFLASDKRIMFVHIREPEEIAKFVAATGGKARTLLIRGGERVRLSAYGNAADDLVENYYYDYYYTNDKPLDVAKEEFTSLLRDILTGNDAAR
ncbi:MAG: hypothetical protein IJY01_03840 [Clostridia bacterium]|nr:hypothetical protein [Clostridia bacterium]